MVAPLPQIRELMKIHIRRDGIEVAGEPAIDWCDECEVDWPCATAALVERVSALEADNKILLNSLKIARDYIDMAQTTYHGSRLSVLGVIDNSLAALGVGEHSPLPEGNRQ